MLKTVKRRALKYAFDRFYRYRVDEFMSPEQAIVLNYRVDPKPRYRLEQNAHPQLWKWFDERRSACDDFIALIARHRAFLERIPTTTDDPREP
ncbi:MAG TPA: hypothetical protein VFS57_01670, partial [Gemmatimonadaceae bacterium]|nr:hypothetical protein [Gemmatimonadaceae bacterium]